MAEVSHEDLRDRLVVVEKQQAEMQATLTTVAEEARTASAETKANRLHFDHELTSLRMTQASTHEQLVEHRAEVRGWFQGMNKTVTVSLSVIGFVVTVGIAIIGWIIEHGT